MEVYNRVFAVMDARDKLIVVNAFGCVISGSKDLVNAMNNVWLPRAA
jgi:hypothetical protein